MSIQYESPIRREPEGGRDLNCLPSSGARCAACSWLGATRSRTLNDACNNAPDNLARLCQTHHWMYDAGLYPLEAIRLLQEHWQTNQGKPSHKARMKDAGAKAALTRKRRAAARKAVATRKLKEESL